MVSGQLSRVDASSTFPTLEADDDATFTARR